jgi:hypothetical protein
MEAIKKKLESVNVKEGLNSFSTKVPSCSPPPLPLPPQPFSSFSDEWVRFVSEKQRQECE